MSHKYSKEEKLKNSLKRILAEEDLSLYKTLVEQLSAELEITTLDCAAALSRLNQPTLYQRKQLLEKTAERKTKDELVVTPPKFKLVRYRLDIGRKHAVSIEQIKEVLVEVSGVDRKRIGKLDIRNYYTLVDLPDGMPADIFQLLAEQEINQQKLNIKRIKYQRRFTRKNHKKMSSKPYVA